MKTVTKYLTRKPQTEAAQELRKLTCTLHKTNEPDFTTALVKWHALHESFLDERSPAPGKRGWQYTHRRIRAAYRSLKTNLPYLFTYQKYPMLNIPHTTNSIDGMFSQLKNKIAVHRGLSRERRFKLICAILATTLKRPTQKDNKTTFNNFLDVYEYTYRSNRRSRHCASLGGRPVSLYAKQHRYRLAHGDLDPDRYS